MVLGHTVLGEACQGAELLATLSTLAVDWLTRSVRPGLVSGAHINKCLSQDYVNLHLQALDGLNTALNIPLNFNHKMIVCFLLERFIRNDLRDL